jgi:methylated-DNA-[protein]-cysteine S-methyltransferase
MTLLFSSFISPLGTLKLVASDIGLVAVLWENDDPLRVRLGEMVEAPGHALLVETRRQLAEYFDGQRRAFDIPLDMRGTPFQREVWQVLLNIPFGETRTYADIARKIGRPTAFRAVGAANGRNPVSIITPCHRAIGSDGLLHGFAGGLQAKKYLLALEKRDEGKQVDLF